MNFLDRLSQSSIIKNIIILIMALTYIINAVTICPADKFYFNDKCYTSCTFDNYLLENNSNNPDGISELYIRTQGSSVCVSVCSNQCMTCRDFADFCTQCRQSSTPTSTNIVFLLEQRGKCFVDYCPQFYFKHYSNKQCILCSSLTNKHCQNCSVNTNCVINGGSQICSHQSQVLCLECDNGYYSLMNQDGLLECVSVVPDGYVNVNNNLLPCSNDCLTCTNIPTTCLTCKTLNFINNQCVDQCPPSHYSKQFQIMFNYILTNTLYCQRCEPQCNTCTNATFCTSCLVGFYLIEGDGLCVSIGQCPQFTYPNKTTYKCKNCVSPCLSCFNENQCKQCVTGYYLLNKQCLSQCPLRTFAENITNPLINTNPLLSVCSPCMSPCETCINSTHCLSCLHSGQLIYYYQPQNSCLAQCPNGYKPDSQLKNCVQCPQSCSLCNMEKCLQCKTINGQQYHLFDNNKSCIQSCPQSYYSVIEIDSNNDSISYCLLCPKQCKKCMNSNYCTQCKQGYYFYQSNNSCLSNCPQQAPVQKALASSNINTVYYECKPCSKQRCVKCTKYDYCIQCQNMSTLIQSQAVILTDNGQCITSCPVNYTKQYNNYTQKWSCELIIIIVPPIDDNNTLKNDSQTNSNNKQSQTKGIVIVIVIPFIASYISAGMFIIIGCAFLSINFFITRNNNNKRLFFPFCAGLLAIVQTLTIGYTMFYHLMYNFYYISIKSIVKAQTVVFFVSIFVLVLMSLVNFGIFCKIMHNDASFQHWKTHTTVCSKFWFFAIFTLSMINFKVMNTFWSKFSFFPVLSTVEKLKPFTIISGLSMIPILGFVVSFILLSNQQQQINSVYYDGIAVLLFSTLINLLSLKRPQDLFIYQSNDKIRLSQGLSQSITDDNSNMKINLHKRAFGTDVFFINSIKPTQTYEQHYVQWDLKNNKRRKYYDNINVNTQKTEQSSQLSIVSSQQRSLNSSLIFINSKKSMRQQNGSNDDREEIGDKVIYTEQNDRKNVRECHSMMTRLYNHHHNNNEIKTDQQQSRQQHNQQLNKAISEIDNFDIDDNENSQMAEFGSVGEEEYQYQYQWKGKQQQVGIQQQRQQQKHEKQSQQAIKNQISQQIENNQIQLIQPQLLVIKLKENNSNINNNDQNQQKQQLQQNHQPLLSVISQAQQILNFIDISQIQHNKQSLLKIDNSNYALIDDSVYGIRDSIMDENKHENGMMIIDLLQDQGGDDGLLQSGKKVTVTNVSNRQKKKLGNKKNTQVLINEWKQQFQFKKREKQLQQKKKKKEQQQEFKRQQKQSKQLSLNKIQHQQKNKYSHQDIQQDSIINNSQFLQQLTYQQQQQQKVNNNNNNIQIHQISILNSSNTKGIDNNNNRSIYQKQINQKQQLNATLNDNNYRKEAKQQLEQQQWEDNNNMIVSEIDDSSDMMLNRIMPVVLLNDNKQVQQIKLNKNISKKNRQIVISNYNNNKYNKYNIEQTALKISKHLKVKVQKSNVNVNSNNNCNSNRLQSHLLKENNIIQQLKQDMQKQQQQSISSQLSQLSIQQLQLQQKQQKSSNQMIIHHNDNQNQHNQHNQSILMKQLKHKTYITNNNNNRNSDSNNVLQIVKNVLQRKSQDIDDDFKDHKNQLQEEYRNNEILEQEQEEEQQLYNDEIYEEDEDYNMQQIQKESILHSIQQQIQSVSDNKSIFGINDNHNHCYNQLVLQVQKRVDNKKTQNDINKMLQLLVKDPQYMQLMIKQSHKKDYGNQDQVQNQSCLLKKIKNQNNTTTKRNKVNHNNQNTSKIIRQQIILMDDNKFKQLKKKLKNIEKQQQKQQKILKKIQQESNMIMMMRSTSTSRQKDQNKYYQSKQKQYNNHSNLQQQQQRQISKFTELKSIPKAPYKRKHKLQLQSKQHIQKIYRNSSFSNSKYINKSIQKKKSLSKSKSKQKKQKQELKEKKQQQQVINQFQQ